jgi:hypothetical protein
MGYAKAGKKASYYSRITVAVIAPRDFSTSRMCIIATTGIGTEGVPAWIGECGVLGINRAAVIGEAAGEVRLGVGRGDYELVKAGVGRDS